jgi:hypothetical protein
MGTKRGERAKRDTRFETSGTRVSALIVLAGVAHRWGNLRRVKFQRQGPPTFYACGALRVGCAKKTTAPYHWNLTRPHRCAGAEGAIKAGASMARIERKLRDYNSSAGRTDRHQSSTASR